MLRREHFACAPPRASTSSRGMPSKVGGDSASDAPRACVRWLSGPAHALDEVLSETLGIDTGRTGRGTCGVARGRTLEGVQHSVDDLRLEFECFESAEARIVEAGQR